VKTISSLVSNRVTRLSSALSRSAALRYRREFDVSLGEWRTLALVGQDPELTLNRLARRAGLDKAQMSRVVSRLVERGLVDRQLGARRSTQLSLTLDGEAVYAGLISAANDRDVRLVAMVGEERMRIFEEVLDDLLTVARVIEDEEEGK
jgi:Transcriptional regulators